MYVCKKHSNLKTTVLQLIGNRSKHHHSHDSPVKSRGLVVCLVALWSPMEIDDLGSKARLATLEFFDAINFTVKNSIVR